MSNLPPADLVQAVKNAAPNDTVLQEALLFGAYGESTWVNAPGPAPQRWGGYYGFTPPYYSSSLWTAPAQTQVNAIVGSYKAAEKNLPSQLSGVSAAEWVALGGERPALGTPGTYYGIDPSTGLPYSQSYTYANPALPGLSEQQVIAGTRQPTQYGAATSFTAQEASNVFASIETALGQKQLGPPGGGFPGSAAGSGPPNTTIAGRNTSGANTPASFNYTNPQGYGQTYSQAVQIAQQDLLQDPPATYTGMSKQMAATMYQQMNPVTHSNDGKSAGIVSDVEGFLTGGIIGSNQYSPLHVIFGTSIPGAAESVLEAPAVNIFNNIKATLVRVGVGLAGLLLMAAGLYIIVTTVTGVSALPMPVPL